MPFLQPPGSGGGGGSTPEILDPRVNYFRENGTFANDGTIAKPFTLAADGATGSVMVFDIGHGVDVGNLYLDTFEQSLEITIQGRGHGSRLGILALAGNGLTHKVFLEGVEIYSQITVSGKNGDSQNLATSSSNLELYISPTAKVESIQATGGSGYDDGMGGYSNGGNGGSIKIVGCGNVGSYNNGGGAGYGGGAAGNNGDQPTVIGAQIAGIFYANSL